MTFQVMTLLMPSTFGIWQDKEHGDQAKDHTVPDRMMVTLVTMMFQVMTILTFFLHYNLFYLKKVIIIEFLVIFPMMVGLVEYLGG